MSKRPFLVAIALVGTAITQVTAQRPTPGPDRADQAPHVIKARHDRLARLRDLPPGLPPSGEMEEHEPQMRHVARHSSTTLVADPVVQSTPAVTTVAGPTRSVEGVGNVNGVLPPDTNGAVGPNHFVQWVNLSFAVYSKGDSTTPPVLLYGPAPGNAIWRGFGGACESTNNGDPIVR